MKKLTFVTLLVVGSAILGSTVLREPIASAAQGVTATIVGPLDGNGNVKVHEQGTADVNVTNPTGPVTTFPSQPLFAEGQLHSAGSNFGSATLLTVPAGKAAIIEDVSANFGTDPGFVPRVMVFVLDQANNALVNHAIELEHEGVSTGDAPSQDVYSGQQSMRLYAPPGSVVRASFEIFPAATGKEADGEVHVSGYFVNA